MMDHLLFAMKPKLNRLIPLLITILGVLATGCTTKPPATPVPSEIRPLIIQPADFGWPRDAYAEYTGTDATLLGQQDVEEALSVYIKPQKPRLTSRGGQELVGIQGAIQDIWVYASEDEAQQDFLYITQLSEMGNISSDQVIELSPALTQSWWHCKTELYSPEIGYYSHCWLLAQHGNIVVRGLLTIDEVLVTYDDWESG
jgi:hypothetical protein